MINKYSILQYAPNPLSGERINIGVIAFGENGISARFLHNWSRVQKFSGQDISFLKEFAEELTESIERDAMLPGMEIGPQFNEALLESMASKWTNSIQVTPPKTSMQPQDALLEKISHRFLVEPSHQVRDYRDKSSAASFVKHAIKQVLEEVVPQDQVSKLLHSAREIEGRYGPHIFDAVIANGRNYVAIQALSFELPEASQLDQAVDTVAFQVFDVRQRDDQLPIGIIALPPIVRSGARARTIYDRAVRTYRGLHSTVISEEDAESWIREQMRDIHLEL